VVDYVDQNLDVSSSVVWDVRQNSPPQLRTIGGERVRSVHTGRADGFVYLVKSTTMGSSGGVVKYARYDGSDEGNLLTGLNQPWGFVSDAANFFVSENGANRIKSWGKSYSPVPAAVGSTSRTYTNVCSIGQPRSLSVISTASTATTLYYVCSDGSSSELRSLAVSDRNYDSSSSSSSVRIQRFSGEIKDMVLGESDGYAYVARGSSGIERVLLSTGASEFIMQGYEHQYITSLMYARGRLFFVDYEHNIHHLGLHELDAAGVASVVPTPMATLDYSELEKDAGTRFVDVYVCGNIDGTEFYLQQSWIDPNESYESVIARVKR
jgi:hypothetical protein